MIRRVGNCSTTSALGRAELSTVTEVGLAVSAVSVSGCGADPLSSLSPILSMSAMTLSRLGVGAPTLLTISSRLSCS